MPHNRILSNLVLLSLLLSLAVPIVGQEPANPPAEPAREDSEQAEQKQQEESAQEEAQAREKEKKKKKPPVEFGVQLRWRSEFRDNADFQPANDFDHFVGQRVRINIKFNLHDRLSFFFQPQDVWLYGAESDKIIHDFNTNLHQAYFDWEIPGAYAAKLRFGRQEFNVGRQRLLGGFAWDNVGRSFDGIRFNVGDEDGAVEMFWGRLAEVRRQGKPFRPGNLDLAGAFVSLPISVQAEYGDDPLLIRNIYFFMLRDSNAIGGELGRPPTNSRIFTYGFRAGATVSEVRSTKHSHGGFGELEFAYQNGHRGLDNHRAAMMVINRGYLWKAPLKPWLKFEYAVASGDNNPTDGRSREFHNLFPTNHLHYGYADREGLRNLHNFRVTNGWKLLPKVRFEADFHKFLLAARRGPWKNAGGAVLGFDPTGASGRDVGQEIDFTVRLPLWKHLKLMGGYSVFFPGAFAKATRGPETHHWGFVQTVVSF